MVQTIGITSLNEAHEKFNISQSTDQNFFTEWFGDLPEVSDTQRELLDRLKNRYLYYAADGAITEGTVNVIILSPILELIEVCDPPFRIRSEQFVKIEIENVGEEEIVFLEQVMQGLLQQNYL
jgi:hypothetical protein